MNTRPPLDVTALRDGLAGLPWRRIDVVEETGSTNADLLARAAADEDIAGAVLFAEYQSEGRGRHGRQWSAPPRSQLSVSVGVDAAGVPVESWGWLPLATGVAVVDAVAEVTGVRVGLKWPNDVQVRGRKIAGLLLDVPAGGAAVLGVGLNVNMTADDAARIDQPATSLRIETGGAAVLEDVLGAFLGAFSRRYADWLAGGFEALRADWVRLAEPAGASGRRGEIAGYGPHGELLIRRPDGGVEACWITD